MYVPFASGHGSDRRQQFGVHCFFEDITERRQADEVLRESEERTRTILESVTVPLLISRVSDGKILYANAPLGDTLLVAVEALIGQQTPDFYYDTADREKVVGIIQSQGYINDLTQRHRGAEKSKVLFMLRRRRRSNIIPLRL